MKQIFLYVCLLGLLMPAYGQEPYELFEPYNTVVNKNRNKALISAEVWMKPDKGETRLTKKEYFNTGGLPDSIIMFNDAVAGPRFSFTYDDKGRIVLISSNGYLSGMSNEFKYMDDHHTIDTYISSGDSLVLFRTKHIILKAGKPVREFSIDGFSKDTTWLISYNDNGKRRYIKNRSGEDIREQFFDWNEDNTRVVIFQLQGGKRMLNEIRYYDSRGNLLRKMEPDNSTVIESFEYDGENKMTASAYSSYKDNYVYDEKGYLVAIHSRIADKISADENLPEYILLEFKYQFR